MKLLGRRIVDEYEWKWDNHVPLASNEELIIYELHVGDFRGKFKDVTENIDYFVQLGITAGIFGFLHPNMIFCSV